MSHPPEGLGVTRRGTTCARASLMTLGMLLVSPRPARGHPNGQEDLVFGLSIFAASFGLTWILTVLLRRRRRVRKPSQEKD